jgi:uncharacterized protein (DUF924 family)
MNLLETEISEMRRMQSYFPFRVISGVKLQDGSFHVFCNSTKAKANNFAKKNAGVVFRFDN